jgi:DNA-binding PadR family transcriptional regulator
MKGDVVNIGAQVKRGSAELAILSVLVEGPLHGYEIAKRIERQTQGSLRFNLASLYPLLYRMEKHGWVKGTWEGPPEGRRRRYYRLQPAGKRRLAPLREEWGKLFRALNCLAGVTHA